MGRAQTDNDDVSSKVYLLEWKIQNGTELLLAANRRYKYEAQGYVNTDTERKSGRLGMLFIVVVMDGCGSIDESCFTILNTWW